MNVEMKIIWNQLFGTPGRHLKDFRRNAGHALTTINRIEADDMIEINDDKKMAGYRPRVMRNIVHEVNHCVNRSDPSRIWGHFLLGDS